LVGDSFPLLTCVVRGTTCVVACRDDPLLGVFRLGAPLTLLTILVGLCWP
jgi:hypothetical protein